MKNVKNIKRVINTLLIVVEIGLFFVVAYSMAITPSPKLPMVFIAAMYLIILVMVIDFVLDSVVTFSNYKTVKKFFNKNQTEEINKQDKLLDQASDELKELDKIVASFEQEKGGH